MTTTLVYWVISKSYIGVGIRFILKHRANEIRHQKVTSDSNAAPSQISSKLRVQVPWPSSSSCKPSSSLASSNSKHRAVEPNFHS